MGGGREEISLSPYSGDPISNKQNFQNEREKEGRKLFKKKRKKERKFHLSERDTFLKGLLGVQYEDYKKTHRKATPVFKKTLKTNKWTCNV